MATRVRFIDGKRVEEKVGSNTEFRKDKEERYKGQKSSGRKTYGENAQYATRSGIEQATSGPAGGSKPGDVATPALDSFTGTEHNAGMSRAVNATQAARQSVVPSAWGAKEGQDKQGDAAAELAAALTSGKPTGDTWEDENAAARLRDKRETQKQAITDEWSGDAAMYMQNGGQVDTDTVRGLENIGRRYVGGAAGGVRNVVNYAGYAAQDAADTAKDTARAVGVNEQFAADFDKDPDAMKPFNEWKASLAPGEYEALAMNGQLPDPRTLYANARQAEAEKAYREKNGELELKRLTDFGEGFQKETQEKYGDIDGGWGLAGDVSETIGQQTPAMLLNAIPYAGAALSTAYLFGSAAGGATEDALAQGAKAEDALAYGTMSGIMEAATERMFDGMSGLLGKGAADEAVESLVSKIGNTGVRNLTRWGLGAAGEGAEELVSAIADPALRTIYNNQDLAQSYGNNLDWGDVIYQGAMGALTGGVMGSIAFVNGQYRAKNDSIESRLAAEVANNIAADPQAQQVIEQAQANATSELNATEAPVSTNPAEVMAGLGQTANEAQTGVQSATTLSDIEKKARQAWKTPYEDEYGTHKRPNWNTTSNSEKFTAALEGIVPNYGNLDNAPKERALYSFLNDLVAHGGDLNPYAAAQAFNEFYGKAGFSVAELVQRAYEIAGQEIPLGIRQEYMPTAEERAAKEKSDAEYRKGIEKYKETRAKQAQAQAETLTPLAQTVLGEQAQAPAGQAATQQGVQEIAQAMAPEQQAQEEPSLTVEEARQRVQQYEALSDEYEKRYRAWRDANDSGVEDYPYVEESRWLSWAKSMLDGLQGDYTEAQRISRTGAKAVSPDYGTPENYIGKRSYESVADRRIKAFQFDHPELHEFFRAEAEKVADGLNYVPIASHNSKKGTFYTTPNKNPAYLALKPYGLSNEGVLKAMEDVMADRGKENAAAKRAELYLHKRLFYGYNDSRGNHIPPNQEYIAALEKIPGALEAMWEIERDSEETALAFDGLHEGDEEFDSYMADWYAAHPRPTSTPAQTPTQEVASALTGEPTEQPSQNSPINYREEISEAPGQAPIPAATETTQDSSTAGEQIENTQDLSEPVPPDGMKRSQSEENGIQAIDEAVGAPEESRNPLYYNPQSEAESTSAARDALDNGYESNLPQTVSTELTPEQGTLLQAAGARLGEHYPKAMSDLQAAAVWTSVQTDMSQMILQDLAQDAKANNDWSAYEAWRKVDAAHGQESARALQARGKRTRATDIINATIDHIESLGLSDEAKTKVLNEALPYAQDIEEALKGLVFDKTTGEPTDARHAERAKQELRDIITRISKERHTGTLIPGRLKKLLGKQNDLGYLTKLAEASVRGISADSMPTDAGQKLKTWQSIAMLLKVTTTMRNLGGNATFGVMDALVGDTLGLALDSAVSGRTGIRSVAGDKLVGRTARQGFTDAWDKAVLEIALDADMGSVGTKYVPNTRAFDPKGNPVERALSRFEQILSISLNASDRAFRGGSQANTVEGLNRANANQTALTGEELASQTAETAQEQASYRLFQNDGAAAQAAKAVHDYLNGLLGVGGTKSKGRRTGGFGLGDIITPFATVPANLGVKAFEYSPAGMVKGLYDLSKVLKDAKQGKVSMAQQNKAVMEISRGVTGVPIAMAFAAAIKGGLIKRADDDDDYKVTKARATENRKDTQWNLDATIRAITGGDPTWKEDDTLVSLSWLEPLNAFMDIGALFAEIPEAENGDFWDNLGYYAKKGSSSYIMGALESFMEIPMMNNIQQAMQTARYMDTENIGDKLLGAGESLVESGVTGMIPGLMGQVARSMDTTTRDTSSDNFLNELANTMLNTVPVARERLPEKLDSFGNPIEASDTLYNALSNTVLPGAINRYKPDDIVQALDSVYEETGKSNAFPDYQAPKSFTYGKTDYELTADEKRAYMTAFGDAYNEMTDALVNSDSFKDLSPAQQNEALAEMKNIAADQARGAVVEGRGDAFDSQKEKILGLSDIPAYVLTKARADDIGRMEAGERDYDAIREMVSDYDDLPADVKKQLETGEYTKYLDELSDAVGKGVKVQTWYTAHDAVSALEKLPGEDDVKTWQKVEAITGSKLRDKDTDILLGQYLTANQYKHYQTARADGVKPSSWSKAYSTVSKLEPEPGAKETREWQKYEAIVGMGKSEKETDALLKCWMSQNSENTYLRYELGRERGFTQKTLVDAYRICAQYSKKDDILPALKEAGYTNWQTGFLWELWKGNNTVKEADKFKKKYKYG